MSAVEFFAAPPRPALEPFVESVWGVRGSGALGAEAVLPNGAVELMVNFGPLQEVIGRGERALRDTYRHAWLAGIHDRSLAGVTPAEFARRGLAPGDRLEASGSLNAMVSHRVRVSEAAEVDDELVGWLREAYDAAG